VIAPTLLLTYLGYIYHNMIHLCRISYIQVIAKEEGTIMNPCRACIKVYSPSPCTALGHCVFEGTAEEPSIEGQVLRLSSEAQSLAKHDD